jgi:serpin B
MSTLQDAQSIEVKTAIPKFESDYSVEMSDILKSMGMTDAFDGGLADFSGLGKSADGNIFISRVIHKTFITVDEKGTKAGAATAVEMETLSAPMEEPKTVYLDRPFVYMLIDCETNLPIFIGTVTDMGD